MWGHWMGKRIAAIILAAGRSSRLGRPKQLVPFQGRTLLRHATLTAMYSPVESVTVVLGAFYPLLQKEIAFFDIKIVNNRAWMRGPGSSLKAGLTYVIANETTPFDGFMFLTCDQPLVNEALLDLMCERFQRRNQIVASSYGGTIGLPAIFGRDHLHALLGLADGMGAGNLLHQMKPNLNLEQVPFKGGDFDVDTSQDLVRLKKFLTTSSPKPTPWRGEW